MGAFSHLVGKVFKHKSDPCMKDLAYKVFEANEHSVLVAHHLNQDARHWRGGEGFIQDFVEIEWPPKPVAKPETKEPPSVEGEQKETT